MAEKPILFKTPMVQAIQRGEKTQTRRVLKQQPDRFHSVADYCTGAPQHGYSHYQRRGDGCWESTGRWPYPYRVGDRLWVKETWGVVWVERHGICPDFICIRYCADEQDAVLSAPGEDDLYAKYKDDQLKQLRRKSSLFMPKWAARIWLEVTGVRVERLQSISEADAIAEGMAISNADAKFGVPGPIYRFAALWGSINAKPKPVYVGKRIDHYVSYPWEDVQETRTYRGKPWIVCGNPWVGVYEFSREGAE